MAIGNLSVQSDAVVKILSLLRLIRLLRLVSISKVGNC